MGSPVVRPTEEERVGVGPINSRNIAPIAPLPLALLGSRERVTQQINHRSAAGNTSIRNMRLYSQDVKQRGKN